MSELGYERFAAQGGDWGSTISTALGLNHAQRIIGIHLNYIAGRFLFGGTLNQAPDDETAKSYLAELRAWADLEAGYSHEQSTKPQTLGYALNDSPVGLAGWIFEKFRGWSDCDGELESIFTRDELLTNVMIYWVTETINSSTRLYYETREQPLQLSPAKPRRASSGNGCLPQGDSNPAACSRRARLQHSALDSYAQGRPFCRDGATRTSRSGYSRILPPTLLGASRLLDCLQLGSCHFDEKGSTTPATVIQPVNEGSPGKSRITQLIGAQPLHNYPVGRGIAGDSREKFLSCALKREDELRCGEEAAPCGKSCQPLRIRMAHVTRIYSV